MVRIDPTGHHVAGELKGGLPYKVTTRSGPNEAKGGGRDSDSSPPSPALPTRHPRVTTLAMSSPRAELTALATKKKIDTDSRALAEALDAADEFSHLRSRFQVKGPLGPLPAPAKPKRVTPRRHHPDPAGQAICAP